MPVTPLAASVLAGGALLLFTTVAAAAPVITQQRAAYEVVGATLREIRQSMNERRPAQDDGKRHDGSTRWQVGWTYRWRQNPDGSLSPVEVRVTATITVTLPHWQPPAGTDPALKERWTRFHQALVAHENGHVALAVQAAQAVEKRLAALPPAPTPAALKAMVDAAGNQVVADYQAKEKRFDAETQHGARQGVRFP